MRSLRLLFVLVFCCLAASAVAAQTPIRSGQGEVRSEEVFEQPVAEELEPAPAPDVEPAPSEPAVFRMVGPERRAPEPEAAKPRPNGIDPRVMAETVTNSVLNSKTGSWDPTLGSLTTGDAVVDRLIVESGLRHGVDPKLIHAVMHQESGFKRKAISHKGTSGFMQLMPGTARRFGVTDIFDPKQNIDAGTKYLRFLLDLFDGNIELALAGYNAGEYRVIRNGYRVPQIRETQNYVRSISARYYGRSKRRYAVVYGPSTIGQKEREEIRLSAYATSDERGLGSLSNIY